MRARSTNATPLRQALIHSQQAPQAAPCCVGCASGADIRGWIAVVAQRGKLGLSDEQALTRAWGMVTAVNPFPATMGRICPHPCEAGCNRTGKDGPVAINALERFLGDWGLKQRMRLPRLKNKPQPESIGAIGAGPAGLSFAYQMARRGYRVTVYEKEGSAGGMLYHGIPQYRLPEEVLEAEIRRILDLGVELKLNTRIGGVLGLERLRAEHDVLFLGIGAGHGMKLGIPGEEGPGAFTGTEYLSRLNRGEHVSLGEHVVVVGGGNTAMDAARSARRAGARVTVLYRRTRDEMPAIAAEIDDALSEGVQMEYLSAPVSVCRNDGAVHAITVQRMRLGEPDSSGRRRPDPVPGSEFEVPCSALIAAVSQVPEWSGLSELDPGTVWARAGGQGELDDRVWTGGDTLGLGIAGMAIAQGRQAAEAVHARLRGLSAKEIAQPPMVQTNAVKPDYYAEKTRTEPAHSTVEARLSQPDLEVQETISERAFFEEASRCFSCGSCFGCEQCFMFCNAGGFTRLEQVAPGAYFALDLDRCEGCGKCVEVCPCGFLTVRAAES